MVCVEFGYFAPTVPGSSAVLLSHLKTVLISQSGYLDAVPPPVRTDQHLHLTLSIPAVTRAKISQKLTYPENGTRYKRTGP